MSTHTPEPATSGGSSGKRPEIIAHRGASRERPENTLAAFIRAVELGADAVELDVHRTHDCVIVVHHDPVLSNGGSDRPVPILSLDRAALRAWRVGGEPIPTLAEVLDVLDGRAVAYCELKGRDSARGTLELLASTGVPGAVHAFDHRQIAEAHRIAPDVPRGVLEASYPVDSLHALTAVSGRDLWRHCDFIDRDLVETAHKAGKRVIAWTVNDAETMQRFAEWGVDALCTDDVALARATV
ncbi:MAG TPA: glycerophosphodiester phosphodiesterase [Gemmatimonadaceae bacterium]|nr:glycerophosphodiester phosphodiesterase [Gemmatimonadaceae bacterium]